MRGMRVLAIAIAIALGACAFDGSGTEHVGDDGEVGPDAAGTVEIDARPIDAAPPVDANIPSIDSGPGACNFDFTCDPGETPDTCWDCGGGGFVCNFDSICDSGESQECPDCDSGGFVCDFDLMCESGEAPECLDCF
jgi:hypothetical protein